MGRLVGQAKFVWTCLILQITFAGLYFLLARYNNSADAKHLKNWKGEEHELTENIEKYPMIVDIHMMLFGGFGFLMTFLRRYGYSAVGFTMLITTVVTEWSILVAGLLKMNDTFTIEIGFLQILDGSLTAAAVLISFGAVLGKLNPFQLLIMSIIEAAVFVLNCHIGYVILGAIDIGGAIFIHTFGAFFGLTVSLLHRRRDVSKSSSREGSSYNSDIFAMVGTVILWVFWPSFNAVLAEGDAMHRAYINTYLSLIGSTVAAFVVSSFFGEHKKFNMVDIQNATLSGGVAVGAVADLMLQPYGAFFAGSITGVISTIGFRKLQGALMSKLKLHDTCGVHNLHGIPGLISGLLSVLMCGIASESTYGPSLYVLFPRAAPKKDSEKLLELRLELPELEAGEGRTMEMQAVYQLAALGITFAMAVVTGLVTGLILNIPSLFQPVSDHQLFDDGHFWTLEDAAEGEDYALDAKEFDVLDEEGRGKNKVSPQK